MAFEVTVSQLIKYSAPCRKMKDDTFVWGQKDYFADKNDKGIEQWRKVAQYSLEQWGADNEIVEDKAAFSFVWSWFLSIDPSIQKNKITRADVLQRYQMLKSDLLERGVKQEFPNVSTCMEALTFIQEIYEGALRWHEASACKQNISPHIKAIKFDEVLYAFVGSITEYNQSLTRGSLNTFVVSLLEVKVQEVVVRKNNTKSLEKCAEYVVVKPIDTSWIPRPHATEVVKQPTVSWLYIPKQIH